MTTDRIYQRDQGVRMTRRITRWIAGAAVGLTALISVGTAGAFHRDDSSSTGALQAPSQAPSTAAPGSSGQIVSGGS